MVRRIFIDTETTGLIPGKHQILTLGMAVYDDRELIFEKEWKICANVHSEINKKAMEINGINILEHNKTAWIPVEVLKDFIRTAIIQSSKTSRIMLYGHNVKFDIGFLDRMFELKPNIKNPFHYHHGDSMVLANTPKEVGLSKTRGVGLSALVKLFGLVSTSHNALEDAKASAEVYFILLDLIKGKTNIPIPIQAEKKIKKKEKDLGYDPDNVGSA